MNKMEKLHKAADNEFLRQYQASKWETAKDVAEGLDLYPILDAILDELMKPTPGMARAASIEFENISGDLAEANWLAAAFTAAIKHIKEAK